jgi:hypothetical protein
VHWSTEVDAAIGLSSTPEAFSPDGSRIAISRGREITLWDVPTGREVLGIKGEASVASNSAGGWASAAVSLVSFSGDGRMLAAVSRDGRIRVWDTREATPERRARREARGLVRWLSARCRDRADLLARIEHDPSLSAPARRFALDLARRRPEPTPPSPPTSPAPGPSNRTPSFEPSSGG